MHSLVNIVVMLGREFIYYYSCKTSLIVILFMKKKILRKEGSEELKSSVNFTVTTKFFTKTNSDILNKL